MAERPRRPSSKLGSELSSPTTAKRRRKSSDNTGAGGASTDLEGPPGESESATEKPTGEKKGESGEAAASSTTRTRSDSGEKLEEVLAEGETLQAASPNRELSTPGPSTSQIPASEGRPAAATGRMDVREVQVVEGGLTFQTSLMGEHAHYQELSLIGNGAYGTVYKAKDITSGQVVALKKVRVPITDEGLPTSTLREIAALKQLERFEHPHIVRLLDVCQGNYLNLPGGDERSETVNRGLTLWLVFEHVERDLASFLASRPPPGLPGHVIKQMSKEILLGVDFLHSHRIIHRDLKPQNLLVTSQGRIKIADFGLAKTYDFEMRLTSVVVTLWYRSPEVLLGCAYATPVDIWSVGCILAELSRLEPLFPGTSEGDQLDRIFRVIGTPSQQEWPDDVSLSWTAFPHRRPTQLRSIIPDLPDPGLDLIQRILTFNPHARPSAVQALAHRYFMEDSS
ncbi:cyclin-dependent kinase 4 [Athalia rosae]|uniref:cyclin-dependent kinase 4 n=1 Tax=Athalia rosae TaxID=37344 RepID=UPI002033D25D|nr:cyclin-dependent kinase 4 [Athalia rosae]